ncbi:MAG: phosphatase PAP2 family protein [Pseudomonadota bacterium]
MKSLRLECYPAEIFIFGLTGILLLANLWLYFQLGPEIRWSDYATIMGAGMMFFAGGLFYRQSGRSPRIGAALIGTSILIVFSMAASTFNYLLLPVKNPMIDAWLVSVDSFFGFHWPDWIAFAAENPTLSLILRWSYLSTLPQLGLLVVVLGLTGRLFDLHVLLTGIAITTVIGIIFWLIFPSMGTTVVYQIPPDVQRAAHMLVSMDYGEKLRALATVGPKELNPTDALGLIAFPSFHMVLASFCVYAARPLRWVFPVFVVINILVIPGTIIHGGHHMIDLPAGIALFALGTWLAHTLVAQRWPLEGGRRVLASEAIA